MLDPYKEPVEETPAPASQEKPVAPEKLEAKVTEKPVAPAGKPMPAPASPPPAAPPATPIPQAAPPPSAPSDLEKDRQLKMLVDLAFSQGLEKAIEAAQATQDPYLIDKFHDTLVDELQQKLIEKGKLKEV